ncbi:MAG: CDP-2,3-bis-(O-geranylgeranyl)-sn-glycerol synthase [Candidatus Micrarchaeota archaeon]|nr:CDP-2,3-bis-(O-geranylgeranyl)-sn-glycerol synthase [Candidatus Micrarchaeota archaeon]
MSLLYNLILYPIIYIFPAYAANGAPILFGGGSPLDRKRKLGGKRILGDNKTLRGTVAALLIGILAGALESLAFPFMLKISIMLTVGAVFGDLLGSFIKRRLDYKSGRSFPIMDQFGFVVFALIFAFWLGNLPMWYGIAFIVVLTGILHPLTNIGAHLLKLKEVPW